MLTFPSIAVRKSSLGLLSRGSPTLDFELLHHFANFEVS